LRFGIPLTAYFLVQGHCIIDVKNGFQIYHTVARPLIEAILKKIMVIVVAQGHYVLFM